MTTTLEAIFEDGVFKPLSTPSGIAEHDQVTIAVTASERPKPSLDPIEPMSDEDAHEMREIIEREFGCTELKSPPLDLIGSLPHEDAAEMRAIIRREFSHVERE